MARDTLKVTDIFELPDGKLAIGLNTDRMELRYQWVKMWSNELKIQFEGKNIEVFGDGYRFETSVLGVEIMNSIADFKNVFLKLDNNALTKKIQINDEVEVIFG